MMRRALILALYIVGWLVAPSPAAAGPIIAAVTAATAAFQAMPLIAQLAIKFVIGFAISAAAGTMLTKKPKAPESLPIEDPGRVNTIRQSAAPRATIYGETRVGGIMVYAEASGGEKNEYLSVLVAIAGHEIAGFEEFFFGDEPLDLDLTNDAVQGRFEGNANIYTHVGTDTQAADATLVEASDGDWTTAHQLKRVAYYHVRLRWRPDQDDDYDRIWTDFHLDGMRVRVRGKKLYDTRDAGTRFSNNPALCVYDYLVNSLQVTAAEIDTDTVNAAANTCEEQVTVVNTTQTFTRTTTQTFIAHADDDDLFLDGVLTGLRLGSTVRVSNAGGALPGGLSAGVDYYWFWRPGGAPGTYHGWLATSLANALAGVKIDLTQDGGSGTQTLTLREETEDNAIVLDNDLRNLRRGCIVRVSTTGALPTGLSAGVDYYYIPVTKRSGMLATSYANSLTGTEVNITTDGSGTHTLTLRSEPRYTASAIVLDTDNPGLVLRTLASAMGGAVSYTGGRWAVFAGESGTATITLDEDDLVGPITVNARRPRSQIFNAVKSLYRDPDRFWQQATAPGIENATYVTDDNGDEIWQDLQLPFTDTDTAAQRLSKIELERARQQITIDFPARLTALQLRVWDVINVTHDNFGWSAKKFRVIGLRMAQNNSVILTLAEEAAAMWSWSAEETTVDPAPDTNLPNFRTVSPPPTPITVTEELRVTASGTVITVLTASVEVSPDKFTSRYDWQWKKASDSTYTTLPDTRNANIDLHNAVDQQTYDIRVRAVNALGFKSSYISASFTPLGQSAPPENVTNFSVNVVEHDAILSWTPVSDVDLSHYVIKHSKQTSSVNWGNSIPLVNRVAKPASSVTVPAMTGTYVIKAVDLKGNESVGIASIGVSITALPYINFDQTVQEETGFTGTHDETWANAAGELQLHTEGDTLADWSAMSAVMVMALGEDGTATFIASGTYTFANAIDAGSIVVTRVTSKLEARGENFSNFMVYWPTMSGVHTMSGAIPGDWDVTLQIRTTTDNPTGSPSWSSWQDFFVGDYRAWGMEFRVRMESKFGPVAAIISECQIDVDFPDHIEDGADVAVGVAGATITYDTAFTLAASISIGLTAQNLGQGDYYTISNKTKTGFDINFYDENAAGVARTMDYQAHGY